MKLLSIIAVLLVEHLKPFDGKRLDKILNIVALQLERWFNAGEYRQGVVAWIVAVLPATIIVGSIWWFVDGVSPFFGWIWNIVILYICSMGFKIQHQYFLAVSEALEDNQLEEARHFLHEWTGKSIQNQNRAQLLAMTIEAALKGSLRYVFAPIFWFVILPGPSGVILYRLSLYFKQRWGRRILSIGHENFGRFFNQVMRVLNWAPMYLEAGTFAIVGNFEDAINACRQQDKHMRNSLWPILAAGAGALGVRFRVLDAALNTKIYGTQDAPDQIHLRALIGLLWRALLFWLLIIGILCLIA